jgi:Methyltransferase domain
MLLSDEQRDLLIGRYQGLFQVPELGYATVKDYCDSCDHLTYLSNYQGDLKDFERPWTVKAVLGLCPPGAKLLEIGAGEPLVAQILSELGYDVTVVDPYEGAGGGPTEYDQFRRIYTGVKILRGQMGANLPDLQRNSFDCIYSISVLEHISGANLATLFQGIRSFLKQRGSSLHSIDHVTAGHDSEFHRQNLADILGHQSKLRGQDNKTVAAPLKDLEEHMREDLDTYYLAPSGHNLWRGGRPYHEFPFRRVTAILSSSHLNGRS